MYIIVIRSKFIAIQSSAMISYFGLFFEKQYLKQVHTAS